LLPFYRERNNAGLGKRNNADKIMREKESRASFQRALHSYHRSSVKDFDVMMIERFKDGC